jgi:putative hydrolase of HD superfamily
MKQQTIEDILTFLRRSKELELIKRYGSSLRGNRNSVADHSWRLGVMVLVIGAECKVRLDTGRALALALMHDLGEAETGDIDAYDQIRKGMDFINRKATEEDAAVRKMTNDLTFGDWIYDMWREYEDQITTEARFVKALDKIEGFLHIAESGVEMYIPKEFHAAYANEAVKAFDEATHHFPELEDLLDAIKADLRKQFERARVEWIEGAK